MATVRLFAALRPPAPVRAHVGSALDRVRAGHPAGPGLRWSPEENLHVTLAFYGELPDGAVGELGDVLAATVADLGPVRLELRGAGVFSHRTLWVGVGGDLGGAMRMVEGAGLAGERVGAGPDNRPRSRPHLTVARLGRRTGSGQPDRRGRVRLAGLEDLARAMSVYTGPAWTAHEVVLMASEPGAGRSGWPLYTPVRHVSLDGTR